jgi:hypothetical protein
VKEFHKKNCGLETAEQKKLGKKYFYNFMARHLDIIHTTKVSKKCVNRLEWATSDNICKMYYLVFKEFVLANIAVQLPDPIYFDNNNNIFAGILLTNCLRKMDELKFLFSRVDGKLPFILLDGHNSRYDMEFLSYIRHEEHKYCCCIGLPYGTHLWQVGDSPAQNGNFKFYEQGFRDMLLREKKHRGMPLTIKPTDIVPIVNYSWEQSFAVVKNNKKAILERGGFRQTKRCVLTRTFFGLREYQKIVILHVVLLIMLSVIA